MANLNTQGPFGNTLLHSAVVSNDVKEVRRLLKAGADPRIANREGQTPLRVAAILGHDDIYQTLSARRDAHIEQLLDHALELALLVVLAHQVARHVGAEAALRANGELLEGQILCRLIDFSF